ncbi:MAG: tRNA preQ1(34) S-adenosylmethionine ribosyltransferase-isomerase QueA, partial [Candidatus Omnitrophica bacterium]|nr:tRNA preQ1(34) S-adenosylmethionine ribosyltransferase-isomerase QueA [Candidatus Omnitrophota bacterium]
MADKVLSLSLSDFDYALPKELIAQKALPKRARARLLVLDRKTNSFEHKIFRDVLEYFEPGDVLVLNDTKVIPARLFGKRKTGGRVEILLLKQLDSIWEALVKPSGRIREGEELILSVGAARRVAPAIVVLDDPQQDTGIRHVQFKSDMETTEILERFGHIPLPPYIDREDLPVDRELYQTVFARRPGAVASPTAGLHFDQELLQQIEMKGVEVLFVTLHVSYGTFQPVATEDLTQHKMYEEYFEVPDETARRINFAKTDGRRIIACGTTVVRALESAVQAVPGTAVPGSVNPARNVPGTVLNIQQKMGTDYSLSP